MSGCYRVWVGLDVCVSALRKGERVETGQSGEWGQMGGSGGRGEGGGVEGGCKLHNSLTHFVALGLVWQLGHVLLEEALRVQGLGFGGLCSTSAIASQ